jgi:hypothetical protein
VKSEMAACRRCVDTVLYWLGLRCGMESKGLLLLCYCVLLHFLVQYHEQIFFMCRPLLQAFYFIQVFL